MRSRIGLPAMKWIAAVTFFLMAVAVCVTVFFVSALKPASAGAFALFAVWLVLPYVVMSIALVLPGSERTALVQWHVVAALVSIGGVVFLADVIFWRPDAQGAIAVLMTPILQGAALTLLLPLASWLSRKARA